MIIQTKTRYLSYHELERMEKIRENAEKNGFAKPEGGLVIF